MLTLNTSSLSTIDAKHGVSPLELNALASRLPEYIEKIHTRNQGFYSNDVLKNTDFVKEILAFAGAVEEKYESIVILGIGGSSLGTIALRDAFGHSRAGTFPECIVLDNVDPDLIAETLETLELEKTLFLVISKSGGTPEILSQYFFFADALQKAGLEEKDHFVFITGKTGILREAADKKDILTFPVSENVGGRFSVLTAVGLLPAALMGINIHELLAGAQEMRDLFLEKNPEKNMPFQLASIQYALLRKGKSINVMYPYAHKLFRVADWFRQLLAESTGKRYSENGKEIFTGLTPIAALGATDQHSQNQLYFEGPNDKFFLFVQTENFENTVNIPTPNDDRIAYLKNIDFTKLLHTEMEGTKGALSEVNRPHVTISLSEISEKNIGALFLLLEGATAFLGEFLNINAFDQPGVELSKNITRELLAAGD